MIAMRPSTDDGLASPSCQSQQNCVIPTMDPDGGRRASCGRDDPFDPAIQEA
jgi:hypothetical protein